MTTSPSFQVAFCILCHKYTPVLDELVRELDTTGNEIYIHVDGKTNIKDFTPLMDRERVHFVTPRIKIYWGGVGMIDATLRLFEMTQSKPFDYIILLSGDTLPLYPIEEIRTLLQHHHTQQHQFVHISASADLCQLPHRICRRHFYRDKSTLLRRIKRFAMKCSTSNTNPNFALLPPLEWGSQWLGVTAGLRNYFFNYIKEHPNYYKAFKYSHCADEHFFQTLTCISPFSHQNSRQSLIYTDWTECKPHPKTFTTADIHTLTTLRLKSDVALTPLFIRKVDDALNIAHYRKEVLHKPEIQ